MSDHAERGAWEHRYPSGLSEQGDALRLHALSYSSPSGVFSIPKQVGLVSEASQGGDRLAQLIARVRKLYCVEAGQPSFPRLARVAESVLAGNREEKEWLRSLPRATAFDLVNGKHKKVPDWLLLRTFVVVCHHIATKSDLEIAPLKDLQQEFSRLWQAAKAGEENATLRADCNEDVLTEPEGSVASGAIGGDILAPVSGERPSRRTTPTMQDMPESWGRLGGGRLRRAEGGDAKAAYEVAVLLACEAAGKDGRDGAGGEAERYQKMAAYWKARATGKIAEAAELRLHGVQLVKAASKLAAEYEKDGKLGFRDFFTRAAIQAEESMSFPQPAPVTGMRTEEEAFTNSHGE